jgi:hypothetical protein
MTDPLNQDAWDASDHVHNVLGKLLTRRGELHSMMFGFVVQKFLNIE